MLSSTYSLEGYYYFWDSNFRVCLMSPKPIFWKDEIISQCTLFYHILFFLNSLQHFFPCCGLILSLRPRPLHHWEETHRHVFLALNWLNPDFRSILLHRDFVCKLFYTNFLRFWAQHLITLQDRESMGMSRQILLDSWYKSSKLMVPSLLWQLFPVWQSVILN